MAAEVGGVLLYLEHRYYGQSFPIDDPKPENMQYLTTQQALSDGIALIRYWNNKYNTNSKVMVFGCSYSGMLASFFRTQYPHLAVAAVSGSAPLTAKANFPEYDATVKRVLNNYGCQSMVSSSFDQVHGSDRDSLRKSFNICEDDFTMDDLMFALAGFVMDAVQANNPDAGYPAQKLCNAFKGDQDAYKAFVKYIRKEGNLDNECLQTNMIPDLVKKGSDRSWYFQKCTEYGYFKTDSVNIFSNIPKDLEYFKNICYKAFGDGVFPDTSWTNYYFGGIDVESSNILYTNGLEDPWANLGMHQNASSSLPVYLYTGAHCAPFHKPTTMDPDNLLIARNAIRQFVYDHLNN
eukprot:TRINITY_DN863_c0_g1_i1.p1 TRINITY_DN863_c0_g1~~TRINITY_DN863_c0_g1_i1.p1  ORF type:complete len:349 (-),score=63.67 TRINITY_DN863_c0_g1_i1:19-1065(-)